MKKKKDSFEKLMELCKRPIKNMTKEEYMEFIEKES